MEELVMDLYGDRCRESLQKCLADHRLNVEEFLAAYPKATCREAAAATNTSFKTAARVKAGARSVSGDTKLARAKAAVQLNPDASNYAIAADLGITDWTVRKARKELAEPAPSEPKLNGGTTCAPMDLKVVKLTKPQENIIDAIAEHFKDRRSQKILVVTLQEWWPCTR